MHTWSGLVLDSFEPNIGTSNVREGLSVAARFREGGEINPTSNATVRGGAHLQVAGDVFSGEPLNVHDFQDALGNDFCNSDENSKTVKQ